jgi:ribonuclease E
MGAIVRTAGVGRSTEELQWDLNNLKVAWDAIVAANDGRPAPFLIFQESDAVTRGLRDYFSDDVGECLIDDPEAFEKAQEYMQRFMPPDAQRKLKLYQDPVPLFTRYQIESQIESAYAHKVNLPSGGSLVIDHTEALVSIDINSARSTRGGDIETTARNTNLEAAEEIARQLRLRDIGGLIVIDFIDMESTANQRAVEDMLRDSVKMDRARIQMGRLSRFGLLEMSRQRLRPALSETTHINCPRCSGMGNIRSVESMSLALLRLIGEEARKERTGRVIAQVPVDVATYLMNEKREQLKQIEVRDRVSLVIVPNPHMLTPAYTLRRVRDDEKELPENSTVSYQIAEQPVLDDSHIGDRDKKPQGEVPLVTGITAATAPMPVVEPAPVAPAPIEPVAAAAPVVVQPGLFVRLWRSLFGKGTPPAVPAEAAPVPVQRDRPREARPDRFRTDRDRPRGDRDRHREPRRDGGRDVRRDRPRGDSPRGEGPRRPDAGFGPERSAAPRGDGRADTGRADAPRADQPVAPRHEPGPRPEGERPESGHRADGPRPEGAPREGGERSGRSRRRRGRGRGRDSGENAANGANPGPNSGPQAGNGAASSGPSPAPGFGSGSSAPNSAGPAPAALPATGTDSGPRDVPPPREPSPPAAAGGGEKYVVWSSQPNDAPRSGPEDR